MTVASYTAPSVATDGTPLKAGDITAYEVGYGTTPSNYAATVKDTVLESGASQSTTFTVPSGTYYAAVRTYNRDGIAGPYGPEVKFVVAAPVIGPPSNFSIA